MPKDFNSKIFSKKKNKNIPEINSFHILERIETIKIFNIKILEIRTLFTQALKDAIFLGHCFKNQT